VGFRERDGAMISGSDALPAGYVGYLVKFAALADDAEAGAVEHAYARMAAAAGVDVPSTRLFTATDGRRYFAAERFDRQRGMRRHVHTLAGLLHADYRLPALDYEGYLKATLVLTKDHSAVREAFRRMVFNVLAHNRDDHTKNFAFVMETDGTWRLTPAYDLTFSSGPGGEHTMAVAGEGRMPGSRQFTELAEKMSIAAAAAAEIISQVEAAVADWPRFAGEAGVAVAKTRMIEERLREVRDRALAQPSTASRRGRARRG
jgi:serine/threonine-protein kinase HipA